MTTKCAGLNRRPLGEQGAADGRGRIQCVESKAIHLRSHLLGEGKESRGGCGECREPLLAAC